jgi:hypothetical protein
MAASELPIAQAIFFQSLKPDADSLKLLTAGGLAQLARALALQAKGHRFDSDILHLTNPEAGSKPKMIRKSSLNKM